MFGNLWRSLARLFATTKAEKAFGFRYNPVYLTKIVAFSIVA